MVEMALEVHIRKKLGNFCLEADFTAENEVFAVLGASGCGKSMLLKCIAGIELPDEGSIILNGRTLYDSKKKICLPPQKRHIGYMFQDYALFPNMTVIGNIQAGMGKRPDQTIVKEYIKKFHLEGLEKHYPAQLSGGQKQRVAMARMLAANPEVILLDEPFSALDSHLKWKLEQQMKKILKEVGRPALFVSHNRDEVYRICHTVGCINNGKMEVIEPMDEFFANPKTKTAAILSGCKNISKARKIDEHTVEATDWGVTFTCKEIPKEMQYIGIRAHYLVTEKKDGIENELEVLDHEILEDPFEWTISFRSSKGKEWIQWKISKREWNITEKGVPTHLFVPEEEIMFLR